MRFDLIPQIVVWAHQAGVGTKSGAELASHVFRDLIESPQPEKNLILKIDFENAFNLTIQA